MLLLLEELVHVPGYFNLLLLVLLCVDMDSWTTCAQIPRQMDLDLKVCHS